MYGPNRFHPWLLAGLASVVLLAAGGCRNSKQEGDDAAPANADGAPAESPEGTSAAEAAKRSALLPPPETVERFVNPRKVPVYEGPTGIVRGLVRASGDPAPRTPEVVRDAKPDCPLPASLLGVLFREGPERSLADVLVAVTGYDGFVPSQGEAVRVEAEGCTWKQRTIALTFGQRLDIVAKDRRAYVPELLGQPTVAQLFVLPGAEPIGIAPQKPGRFVLLDSMRIYSRADVFTLIYPTFDVTGLDGRFEIDRIPVGKVKVSAFLPATGVVREQEVEVRAGQSVEVAFELPFDAAAHAAQGESEPSPEAAGSTEGATPKSP